MLGPFTDPKKAILHWVSQRPIHFPDILGGSAEPDLDSARFLKARAIPGHQCHAISWNDISGWSWSPFIGLVQDANGLWRSGRAGASCPIKKPGDGPVRSD
jgi:hypothetical protein